MPRRVKPGCHAWNLASPTAGLRIFQAVGACATVFLLSSVGSQFTPSYAVSADCILAVLTSLALIITTTFDLPHATPQINWIFWELLYTGCFSFMFFMNTVILIYSSLRWQHSAWWLATVVAVLTQIAFMIDLFRNVTLLSKNPTARHSQDDEWQRKEDTMASDR